MSADDVVHESRITHAQLAILGLCFLVYILDGFDIVIIAFAAPAISQDWDIPAQQLGLVFSSGVLGMALGAMFLSPLADLYGRRTLVSSMLLLAGAATYGVVFTDSVTQLMALRLIAGLGLGALVPALIPLTGDYSPRRYRTLILSLLFSGASVGPVAGGLLAAPLIADHGWQVLFQYAGLLTIVVGVLFHLAVPESMSYLIKRRPDTALVEVNRILVRIGQDPAPRLPPVGGHESGESASVASLLTARRRTTTLLTWAAFFLGFACVYFLTSWTPQILAGAGFDQERAIRGGVVIALGAIIGTPLFGWLARWLPLNILVAAALVASAALVSILSVLLRHTDGSLQHAIWPVLFLTGVTLLGGFTNLYTVVLTIYPAQVCSTGMGWASAFGRGGAVISPSLAGLLIAAGVSMPTLFLFFAIPILGAALCVLLVGMKELP